MPLPGVTEVVPETVQAPPWSAVPQPLATVRLNVSWANGVGPTGAVGATSWLTVPVAPWSSVTVR